MRIVFDRDKQFTDEDFGVIDIGAEKSASHLKNIDFEDILVQNLIFIRRALKAGDTKKVLALIETLRSMLHTYFDEDDEKERELVELDNRLDVRYYKNMTESGLKRMVMDVTINNYCMRLLNILIKVIKKNGFLYDSDLYLKFLYNQYSDVVRSIMFQNPLMAFKSILMLRVLVNPYFNSGKKLDEAMGKVRRSVSLIFSNPNLGYAEKIKMFNNVIEKVSRELFDEINEVMDRRGLLGHRTEVIDLSLVNFEEDMNKLTLSQKMATTLIKDIRDRLLKYDQNWLAVIVGRTGSGKSWSALSLAHLIDPTFTAKRVAYSFDDFMRLITSDEIVESSKGKAVVWDEAGVGIDNRKWASKVNILTNTILQTFRHENLAVIFTVPDPSFVDSKTRMLFHHIIETKSILRKEKKVKTRWYEIHRNISRDKSLAYHPRVMVGGRVFKIRDILIPKAPASLIREYIKTSKEFKVSLKEDAKVELREVRTRARRLTAKEFNNILKEIMKQDISKYATIKRGKYFFSDELIRFNFNVSRTDAKKLKLELERIYNGE